MTVIARLFPLRLLLVVAACGLLLSGGIASAKGSLSKVEAEFEKAIKRVTPTTVVCLPAGVDPKKVPSASSGVIISKKGYVLSDGDVGIWLDVPKGVRVSPMHVRRSDEIMVRIANANGRGFKTYPAKVIRRSQELDTTLMKLEKPPSGMKALTLGSSDELRVGDFAFVMGNSFGLASEAAPTLTAGIIASLVPFDAAAAKHGKGGRWGALYTSAAVNPGVNGGPFVDVHGRLIGTISSSVVFRGRNHSDPELAYSYLGKVVPVERLKAHYKDLPEYDDAFPDKDKKVKPGESAVLSTVFHHTARKAYRSLVSLKIKRKAPLDLREPAPPRGQPTLIPRYLGSVSGVLISQDGYILTSLYNLANISTLQTQSPWMGREIPPSCKLQAGIGGIDKVDVFLPDGREMPAKLVSWHEGIGLALFKLEGLGETGSPVSGGEGKQFDLMEPAPAERFQSGNFVLGLGNPFGEKRLPDPLLTVGVLSKQHAPKAADRWAGQWQTDAGVTDGNCGGAAVDLHGRLYGILSIWTSTRHGRNSGIGFIIPWPQIEPALGEMKRGRSFRLPFFGIRWAVVAGVQTTILSFVDKEAAAGKAGLRKGDRIAAIDGIAVSTPDDVRKALQGLYCDDEIVLKVDRGGEMLDIKVKLGARP